VVFGDISELKELCRQIEEEQDPREFSELVKRLNDLLDAESSGEESENKKTDSESSFYATGSSGNGVCHKGD
jgi:hypothetical protein